MNPIPLSNSQLDPRVIVKDIHHESPQKFFRPEVVESSVLTIYDAPFFVKLARHILSIFAKHLGIGYGLVPLATAKWYIKCAENEEATARFA